MSLLDWNSIENSRHGIIESIKCTTENLSPRWNSSISVDAPYYITGVVKKTQQKFI